MKRFILIFALLALTLASSDFIFSKMRLLSTSSQCSNHGYLYKGHCFCQTQWGGQTCNQKKKHGWSNSADKCDDLTNRLDHLLNISPDNYPGDDSEFPRNAASIGQGNAAYGNKGNAWKKLTELSNPITVFGKDVVARDIKQGALGNCYLLAALASLANIRDGEPIKNIFITKSDNSKHVFVTRWLLDGKPRYVAVDQYVPAKKSWFWWLGVKSSASFSTTSGKDKDFWGIILEKAWAKIHGNYMVTEAGWHTDVWAALTQAPVFNTYHSTSQYKSADDLWTKIKGLLDNEYAVGSATVSNSAKNLVQGHAYSVLNAYDVTLDNGSKQKLLRVFNPWSKETWTGWFFGLFGNKNPWRDGGSKWTSKVKSQVKYENKNDGVFFLTAEDYKSNFGVTNWCEVQKGYSIIWKDIQLTELNQRKNFRAKFTVNGNSHKTVYVNIEQTNNRLIKGCSQPFYVSSARVHKPNGGSTYAQRQATSSKVATITNAADGDYEIDVTVTQKKAFHKYFTVTVYAQTGVAAFD